MKKHCFILLLLVGLFFMPNSLYACGKSTNKTEKQSCKRETSSQSLKDCCCCNKTKNKKHNGCEGKCGHSNCTTPSITLSSILNHETELNLNSFDFSSEKQKFYLSETNTSKGFYLMWFIPKIG